MNERDSTCFNQYSLNLVHIRKARGALVGEDNKGNLYLLQECFYSPKRIEFEIEVLSQLQELKGILIDCYLPNNENEFITNEPNGNSYLLKKWYLSKECDMKNIKEVKKAMQTLALLHQQMNKVKLSNTPPHPFNLERQWEKRFLEMRRIQSFIRKKKQKSDFELVILHTIEEYLEEARNARNSLRNLELEKIPFHLCHGDYNYHNVLFVKEGMMVTQFHQMYLGYQVFDIYYFLRKFLEKNHWNFELFRELLEVYQKESLLTCEEKQLLYLHFLFPDKYWKQLNRYMNTSKTWIPERYFTKLKEVCIQQQSRKDFLVNLREIMYNDGILCESR
jgi:CotS family spore coat protein